MEHFEEDDPVDMCGNTDNKRRLENDEENGNSLEVFKKARYSWQIKGKTEANKNPPREDNDKHLVNYEQGTSFASHDKAVTEHELPCTSTVSSDSEIATYSVSTKDSNTLVSQTDKKSRHSSAETQTKFDMLREIGNEYTERIEEFLKSQAKDFVNTCESSESSDSDCEDIEEEAPTDNGRENPIIGPTSPHPRGVASNGRLSFDSPQLLCNISGWLWQKQEIGCAIVDNVFNRTIEEMGLSPDPEANLQATTRLRVEHQSIEAVISNQGLALQDNMDEDTNDYISSTEDSEESTDRTNFDSNSDTTVNQNTHFPNSLELTSNKDNKTNRFRITKDEIKPKTVNDTDITINTTNKEIFPSSYKETNKDCKIGEDLTPSTIKVEATHTKTNSERILFSSAMGNDENLVSKNPEQNTHKAGREPHDMCEVGPDSKMEVSFVENNVKNVLGDFEGSHSSDMPDNILDFAVSAAIKTKGLL